METNLNKLPNKEELKELAEAMEKKYAIAMKGRTFHIKSVLDSTDVLVTVTLKNEDESMFYPVESKMDYKTETMSVKEAAIFLIDYIDTYFEEFLIEEEEDLYLPIDWKEHQYDAVNFSIRGQIRNLKLEKMADHILGQVNDELQI